jgi:hypothetical protein
LAPVRTRPLPGIRFETVVPPPVSILPRMDIAAFVGFAASGPVHTPVAVDDPARFAAIFGDEAPMFWDERSAEQVSGLLAPAVRSFFRNGGRRCWVVRVAARPAGVSRLPIPGVVYRRRDGYLRAGILVARSQGSWSDPLRLGAALSSEGLAARPAGPFAFVTDARAGAAPGDLLRLSYRNGRLALLAAVAEAAPSGDADVRVRVDPVLWLRRRRSDLRVRGTARFVGADEVRRNVPAAIAAEDEPGEEAPVTLDIEVGAEGAPTRGAPVRVRFENTFLWLRVTDVRSVAEGATRVTGVPAWPLRKMWRVAPDEPPERAERLTLELRVYRGEAEVARLDGLGFAPGHPRFLGDLPTDDELFGGARPPATPPAPLWREAADPRFPLAAPPARRGAYLPLAVPALAEPLVGPWRPRGTPLHRDGLDVINEELFLDDALAGVPTARLQAEADFVRYERAEPRALRGIHALLGVEEPTIVAVPDAVHRRWERLPAATVTRPVSPDQPADPRGAEFDACARRLLRTPALRGSGPDAAGHVSLGWDETDAEGATYVVQESPDPRFAGAVEAYRGPDLAVDLYGRGRHASYFRVRAEAGGNVSRWSEGYTARPRGAARWARVAPEPGPDPLLASVHAALLRLCAARGDVVALLSLPEHHRVEEARAHLERLASMREGMLGAGEGAALGYGALYHPWLVASAPERPLDVRAQPPDGAAAGVLAGRALARGAWVAPANEPLADVVALKPPLPPEALPALQELQVNAVRRAPEGFLWLASDTLARDPDRRPLNVRRLLNLLRRAALRNGTTYVFEPNDGALRRRVQRGFEELLGRLFDLGAFAGATRDESFQVAVDSGEARLLAELRVAPSLPLRFLVVRLVQRGDGAVLLEEV